MHKATTLPTMSSPVQKIKGSSLIKLTARVMAFVLSAYQLMYSKEVTEEVVKIHVADEIADSRYTVTDLCSKEVEMVVLEDSFVRKDEAQSSAFVDLSIVGANN
ncbi:hypothetical protein Tco_1390684 [Tanacetum coccineum]